MENSNSMIPGMNVSEISACSLEGLERACIASTCNHGFIMVLHGTVFLGGSSVTGHYHHHLSTRTWIHGLWRCGSTFWDPRTSLRSHRCGFPQRLGDPTNAQIQYIHICKLHRYRFYLDIDIDIYRYIRYRYNLCFSTL